MIKLLILVCVIFEFFDYFMKIWVELWIEICFFVNVGVLNICLIVVPWTNMLVSYVNGLNLILEFFRLFVWFMV